jgi:hypothetical protein
MSSAIQTTWWLLPTLPEGYLESIERLIKTPKDESNISTDIRALITESELKLASLQKIEHEPWIWDVNLIFHEWSTYELHSLSAYTLPPMKYQVQVNATSPSAETLSLLFTPAELRIITLLNNDLGRRIGDELDGRRPSQS